MKKIGVCEICGKAIEAKKGTEYVETVEGGVICMDCYWYEVCGDDIEEARVVERCYGED